MTICQVRVIFNHHESNKFPHSRLFFWIPQYFRVSVCLVCINIILNITNANTCRADYEKILVSYLPPAEEVPVSAVHAMLVLFRA
jgi:hypothetical protein